MLKLSILILTIILTASIQATTIDDWINKVNNLSTNSSLTSDFLSNLDYLASIDPHYLNYKPEVSFNCDTSHVSPQVPTSVHKLRPSDIKVTAALGDSLTAALGAKASTVLGLLTEYRGVSWSIGGQSSVENVITLPNIIKKFSPGLKGFSTCSTLAKADHDALNVAISGQEANHIPDQARNLIKLMKNFKGIDYANDWKLVTMFIGGNDLTRICDGDVKHSPESYVKDIQAGLDILQSEMPRTLVNFVSILNVMDLKDMNKGLACSVLHKGNSAAYPCTAQTEEQLVNYTREYRRLTDELIDSGRYDTTEDFSVVVQPFMKDFSAPRLPNGQVDLSYFAPDCFHFAAKSHGIYFPVLFI